MFKLLIKKEIQQGVISLRYMLTLVLTITVFIASAVFFIRSHRERMTDFNDQSLERQEALQENAKHLNSLSQTGQYLTRSPKLTELFASGNEKNIPDRVTFTAFYYAGYENIDRNNFRLDSIVEMDWVFIIGLILSFTALVMTFDRISGEKERGTLRLQCANSLSRFKILTSKYIACLVLMGIALGIGMVLNFLIVSIGLRVFLIALYPGQILLIILITLIYLSIFLLIGLLISSRVHNSASSLAISLLIWTTLLIFIPGGGSMLGQKLHRIRSSYQYYQERSNAWQEIWSNAPVPESRGYWDGRDFPYLADRVKLVNRLDETMDRFREERFNELLGQVRSARLATMLSPYTLFRYAMESVSGTGLEAFVRFYSRGKLYRDIFSQFVYDKDEQDPDSYHQICAWHPEAYSDKPVPVEDIPVFTEPVASPAASIYSSRISLLILIGFNLLFGMLSFLSFQRYDIR
jgi:ABC-type transport system involved in multi-copper enzyme maturation permease subunit